MPSFNILNSFKFMVVLLNAMSWSLSRLFSLTNIYLYMTGRSWRKDTDISYGLYFCNKCWTCINSVSDMNKAG